MIVKHYSRVIWDTQRWPNFSPQEFACKHCGEFYAAPLYFDAIQKARTILGAPVRITSAHRCALHNARVGGAPLSEHKKIALDIQIDIRGHDLSKLKAALVQAGFNSFGYYSTFIHADQRFPARRWASKEGAEVWAGLM